jgi:hypothetical protein
LVAVVVVSRSKKTDLYQFALISIWLVGVIAIYARYGEGQDTFYSNDQQFHRQIFEYYLPNEGFHLGGIVSLRYLVTYPVYIISTFGFNALLVNKFLQLIALIKIYKVSSNYLKSLGTSSAIWHLPFLAGPLLIFMSLLSLRDVVLVYFSLLYITSSKQTNKIIGFFGAFLLRPHLGVALLLGYGICLIAVSAKIRVGRFRILWIGLAVYICGTFTYWIGAAIRQGVDIQFQSSIFNQFNFSQMAANFLGIQFLGLNNPDKGLVAASTFQLLFSRLLFFETILIPLLFLFSIFRRPEYLAKQKATVFYSFLFFYGVVSQTTWNSTRQNIPFLACMGVLAVADIEHFRKIKAKVAPKLLMASR